MPAELGEDIEAKDMETIYDGDLDLDEIIKNPVLKPIAEINKSYENLEQLIYTAVYEYQQKYDKIKTMIEENPKYGETMLVNIILNMIEHIRGIIKSQDIQKQNMKDAINEMIKIVKEKYAQVNEEKEFKEEADLPKKPLKTETNPEKIKQIYQEQKEIKEIDNFPKEIKKNYEELSKIANGTSEKKEEEAPTTFHSDILDKDIPLPKKNV